MFQNCAFILHRGDLWKLSCLLLPTHGTISWNWSDSPNNAMCAQHTKVLRTYEACSGARWAALRGSLSWWTLCAALSRAASLRQWGQRRLHRRTRMLAGKRMGVGTAAAFTALHLLPFVSGHGRLMDPPARNSMWRWKRNCKIGKEKNCFIRFGFINPINYNDNEVFCGGVSHQFEKNGGRYFVFFHMPNYHLEVRWKKSPCTGLEIWVFTQTSRLERNET